MNKLKERYWKRHNGVFAI